MFKKITTAVAISSCLITGVITDHFVPSAKSAVANCDQKCRTKFDFFFCNGNGHVCSVFSLADCYFCQGPGQCRNNGAAEGTTCFEKGTVIVTNYDSGFSNCGCVKQTQAYYEDGTCSGNSGTPFGTTHYVCNIEQP